MISAETAAHYQWGAECDGWHLLKSDGLSVIQERMPAGTSEARHFHHAARQFFFVLAGTLKIESAEATEILQALEGLEIAPGVVHRVFNDSQGEVSFLVISQPPSHGDRVNA